MKSKHFKLLIILLTTLVFITGCKKNDGETAEEDPLKDYLATSTQVAYSAGNDSNWSYGNQRKEFPNNDSCYVRVGVSSYSTKWNGKGKGDTVEVTYRFTGAKACAIEVSDGKATKKNSSDSNIIEFTKTITVDKSKKKAVETVMIFRYTPSANCSSVTLEVLFDDQIAEKYDILSTVYFVNP